MQLPPAGALGPLFIQTEVYLLDDVSGEAREMPQLEESPKIRISDEDVGENHSTRCNELADCDEEVALVKKLSELGLPISFHTNKEKRREGVGGKKKSAVRNLKANVAQISETTEHGTLKEGNSLISTASGTVLSHETDGHGEVSVIESVCEETCDVLESISCMEKMPHVPSAGSGISEECYSVNEATVGCRELTAGEVEFVNSESLSQASFEAVQNTDSAIFQEYSDSVICSQVNTSGEWMACWDDFYSRTYYYNLKTEESTWDPPPQMEAYDEALDMTMSATDQLSTSDLTDPEGLSGTQESKHAGKPLSCQLLEEKEDILSTFTLKRRKKVRKKRDNRNFPLTFAELCWATEESLFGKSRVIKEDFPRISKYWRQRYSLFSKFDSGIKMDEEGWFSVTPEAIAKHHALRCGNGSVVDFFTGVGGNAIQFAQRCKHVFAIDIDPEKVEYARHNAAIYGVEDNIDFIKGDSFSLAPKLKADVVFMSPPWGGPAYSKVEKFDVQTMLKPQDGQVLFDLGKEIAAKIVMFLPKNVDISQLAEIALSSSPPWFLEVERNFLNGRLKAVTAYFSQPPADSLGKRQRCS